MDSTLTQPKEHSVFDEPEITTMILMARLYDVQMALLAHFDAETAGLMSEIHKNGDFMAPPPTLNFGDGDA